MKSKSVCEGISSRGERLNMPGLPYIQGVFEGFSDPYDPGTKNGVILLAVAENKLCWDVLKPKVIVTQYL